MREKVCIVLNEREPSKQKAVEALISRLAKDNITASRLPVNDKIEKIIIERRPSILVLDYLLGDFSTGLDILTSIQELSYEERPRTFFLTDEPSVPVAVEAMRLGALNYFELENPQSVQNLAREISKLIKSDHVAQKPIEKRLLPQLDDLIAQSDAMRNCVEQSKNLAARSCAVCIVLGPKGSGRTTISEAIHRSRSGHSFLTQLNLSTFDGSFALNGHTLTTTKGVVKLAQNLSLLVEDAEQDESGELLELISENFSLLWPNKIGRDRNSYLTVTTASQECARAWKRLIPATELVELSALDNRESDIAPLVQRFVRETESLSGIKIKPLASEVVTWIKSLDWPGNVSQLRSSVIDAAIACSLDEQYTIQTRIELNRALWMQEQQFLSADEGFDSQSISRVLHNSGHNYRVAAAKLGISSQEIRRRLSSAHTSKGENK